MVTPADGPSFELRPRWDMHVDVKFFKKFLRDFQRWARERTYDNAARADSCITFPIDPVT